MLKPDDVIRDVTVSCTKALFGDYQVSVSEEASTQKDDFGTTGSLLSVIGFGGKEMRGSLVMSASEQFFREANPSGAEIRDWAGELSNQLLGRIKNRMLSYGAELQMSTPVTIRGLQVQYGGAKSKAHLRFRFKNEQGNHLDVCFDAEYAANLQLQETGERTPDEGDALFF